MVPGALHGPAAEEKKSSEQENDGDDSDGSNGGWGLLERACRYFESGTFQEELDAFARKHAREFEDAVDEENKAGEHTHRLRYSELYSEYLQLFEDLLSDFLEEEGRTTEELFSDMKDAKENNYTPLFEEHQYHGFVESLLAAMEYRDFYRLMLATAAKEHTAPSSSSRGAYNSSGGRASITRPPATRDTGNDRGSRPDREQRSSSSSSSGGAGERLYRRERDEKESQSRIQK